MQWKEQFKPVADLGWDTRDSQEKLANAIIHTLNGSGKPLVGQAECGTGKSLAALIPIIHKIKEARKKNRAYRAVVSTETITLQRQLEAKDLPFLQGVYKDIDFSFHKLLGRSNYFCLDRAKEMSINDRELTNIVDSLDRGSMRLTSGERYDCEDVLGYSITNQQWKDISGENNYCAENKCTAGENCYAANSRASALQSDIVIINHAILAIDFELKAGNPESDGMLGPIDSIIIDEAHKLEETLSSQWTERYTQYEVTEHLNRIVSAAERSAIVGGTNTHAVAETLQKEVLGFYKTTLDFFCEIEERAGRPWDRAEVTFKTQYITRPSPKLKALMDEFEIKGLAILETMSTESTRLEKAFVQALDTDADDNKFTKEFLKDIRKGLTSIKFMTKFAEILKKSMASDSGIVDYRGLTYGTVIEGYISQGKTSMGEKRMTIRAFPIDISNKAKKLWSTAHCVFISATLVDLTRDDFAYFKRSLGIADSNDLRVSTPFNMFDQQIVYVTKQSFKPMEGAHFSLDELVELVSRANGRSLLLFTSRKELLQAQELLNQYKVAGKFPYTMYVQDPEIDKSKLVDQFKNDTHSVLLGLKSFFTGVDIPGESLSLVAVCKWPNPRFSTECRMKMNYWSGVGFPQWYSRESLTVFQQAAGRLIRSKDCRGVVSILDHRAFDSKSNVFKSAHIGVSTLGSRVTHSLDDVSKHLGVLHEV